MNLDLLIKLVKLANNNPNENEANSAARRVCKLIAEGDYKFTNVAPPKKPSVATEWNAYDDLMNMVRDIKQQDAYRQQRQYEHERARNAQQADQKSREQYERQAKEKWTYEPVFKNVPYEPSQSQQNYYAKPKKEKEKRVLKCCICGKERETAFVGPPQVYRCMNCDWDDYHKNRNSRV